MMFKTFEEEIKELNLNMYKYILEGKQTGYPQGFWYEEGSKETFKTFLLHYIHEVLGYPKDEIPYDIITKSIVTEAKLIVGYMTLFDGRVDAMFKEIFPEAFPFKLPFYSDDIWYGKGYWEGHEPLEKTFANWYFKEYLGLTEDNVLSMLFVGDENALSEEDRKYRLLIRNRYRSMHKAISIAFPNKDIEKVKSALKGRTTSRSGLNRRRKINPKVDLSEPIRIYQCDDNCYFTNTGCGIHLNKENGSQKLMVKHFDRQPTRREIEYIRNKLLENNSSNDFYLDIDESSKSATLHEIEI